MGAFLPFPELPTFLGSWPTAVPELTWMCIVNAKTWKSQGSWRKVPYHTRVCSQVGVLGSWWSVSLAICFIGDILYEAVLFSSDPTHLTKDNLKISDNSYLLFHSIIVVIVVVVRK